MAQALSALRPSDKLSYVPCINASVYIYSRVETGIVELELPFPSADRGRTRMGEDSDWRDEDKVYGPWMPNNSNQNAYRLVLCKLGLGGIGQSSWFLG